MNDGAPPTRILFQIDEKVMEHLQYLRDVMELVDEEERQFANVMSEGLRLLYALIQHTRNGLSRVILENPDTGLQKEMEIPILKKLSELYKKNDLNI